MAMQNGTAFLFLTSVLPSIHSLSLGLCRVEMSYGKRDVFTALQRCSSLDPVPRALPSPLKHCPLPVYLNINTLLSQEPADE